MGKQGLGRARSAEPHFCPGLWFLLTKDPLGTDLASAMLIGRARTRWEVPLSSYQNLSASLSRYKLQGGYRLGAA